jgi:L-lactate dehydrogenase complex protein LldE
MVRQQFHALLHDDPAWSTRVKSLAARTYEFVEFLERVQQLDPAGLSYPKPLNVTYHYTCHLRHLGITDQSIRLLNSVVNVHVQPLEKSDQCCGFGGTFALKYPQISRVMVEDKVANIRASGADVAICNDAGCTMNIAGLCNRQHVPTRLMHIAELLAESMGLAIEEL